MSLEIIYSSIVKGRRIILADYTEYKGNFQQILLLLFGKLEQKRRSEIIYDNYVIYSFDQNDISYVCITEDRKSSEKAFDYLNDLKMKFLSTYTMEEIQRAFSYQLKDFSKEIQAINKQYEDNLQNTSQAIHANKKRKEVLRSKAEDFFNQNDKLELIAQKTQRLNESKEKAPSDLHSSRKRKRRINRKHVLLIFLFIALSSYIIWSITRLF